MQILSMAPVTVERDPVLAAAQPGTMASAATDIGFVGRLLFRTSSTIGQAVSGLEAHWIGMGGPAFEAAADPTSEATSGAAAALCGAAAALSELAQGIGDAQRMAAGAQLLAGEANYSLIQLQRSVRETELHGPGGGPLMFGFAPTGAQVAAAQQISNDQQQAVRQMALANTNARAAWQKAQQSFDLVTSQSPSVGPASANTDLFGNVLSEIGNGIASIARYSATDAGHLIQITGGAIVTVVGGGLCVVGSGALDVATAGGATVLTPGEVLACSSVGAAGVAISTEGIRGWHASSGSGPPGGGASWPTAGHGDQLPQDGEFPYDPPTGSNGQPLNLGRGQGFRDAAGNVWQWARSTVQHGGPHWDVQLKGGGYINVTSEGKVF